MVDNPKLSKLEIRKAVEESSGKLITLPISYKYCDGTYVYCNTIEEYSNALYINRVKQDLIHRNIEAKKATKEIVENKSRGNMIIDIPGNYKCSDGTFVYYDSVEGYHHAIDLDNAKIERQAAKPDVFAPLEKIEVQGNPKMKYGDLKDSVFYIPMWTMLVLARILKIGALKYGFRNWRAQPIKVSTYYNAMFRHMVQYFDLLEDVDEETKESHLYSVMANCIILLDAERNRTLIDDRGHQEALTK